MFRSLRSSRLSFPGKRDSDWTEKLYRGLNRAAARFDVSIVGGETSSTGGPAVISVSVSGFVEKNRWVSRSGGKVGDDLFVTGRLGRSLRGKHLRFVPRIEESRWLTKNFSIHAMMDLSDGLGADLPRLARASKVGFKIDMEHLPLAPGAKIDNAISDGEDYELLFAISPREATVCKKSWRKKFPKLPLTRIGRLHPTIQNPQSTIARWLRSFQIVRPKRKSSARDFAKNVKPGACIALKGELGTGKTQFVKGAGRRVGQCRRDQSDIHHCSRIRRRARAGLSFRFFSNRRSTIGDAAWSR